MASDSDLDIKSQQTLSEFYEEATELLLDLDTLLNLIEQDQNGFHRFENFGQIIDRIMGTAKTLNFDTIATFCELSKVIAYKASQVNDLLIANVVVAVLFDAIDLLKKMIDQQKTGNSKVLENLNLQAFSTRLKWLSDKFKHIERASCNKEIERRPGDPQGNLSQASIDELLASLGL